MAFLARKAWKPSKNTSPLALAQELDLTILMPALLLAAIGVAMVYSATFGQKDMPIFYLKQVVWISIGLLGMLFFASFNYQVLIDRYGWPAYWILLCLLAVILAAGTEVSGSKRWLMLGPFAFQPSEFAKVATTMVLAKYLAARQDKVRDWQTIILAFLIAAAPMALILKEPDLGTSLVFIPMLFFQLYTVGVPWRRLFNIAGSGLLVSPLVWFLMKDYQRARIMVFLNPSADTLGAGYNIIQSKIAIGSGGLLGKGWLAGTQGQLKFVPEHHTDFIFAVLSEEWGFAGTMVLLLLFALLLLQMLRIARASRDMAGSLVAVGLTTIMFTQVVTNLGVATGILPVTGMTLPYISYGGSSILTCFCVLGILMSIWSGRKIK